MWTASAEARADTPWVDTSPRQTPPWANPPPQADTHPQADTPLGRHPPGQTPTPLGPRQTPLLGRQSPRQTPPRADTLPNCVCCAHIFDAFYINITFSYKVNLASYKCWLTDRFPNKTQVKYILIRLFN